MYDGTFAAMNCVSGQKFKSYKCNVVGLAFWVLLCVVDATRNGCLGKGLLHMARTTSVGWL
jgi:hypothetical protein